MDALDEYIRSVYSTEYNIYQVKKRFAPFIKGLTSVNTGTTTTTTGTTVVNTEPDKKDYKGDIENAKKDLGYKPEFSYIRYLQDYKNEQELNRFAELWRK